MTTSKSQHAREYAAFLTHLRKARKNAGISQEDLAARLRKTQSAIGKMERGERRVDVVELIAICDALGTSPQTFVRELQDSLSRKVRR